MVFALRTVLVLPEIQVQQELQEIQVQLEKVDQDQPELQDPLELQVRMDKPVHPDLQDLQDLTEALEKRAFVQCIALLMEAFSLVMKGRGRENNLVSVNVSLSAKIS